MKKSFAILLLTIHLFNIFGYRIFFSFAEKEANKKMIASLDEDRYSKNNLIELKVALSMPYLTNNKDYERCDGQIELNGIQYNYVKRMIKNDTLYMYCIPNHEKTELHSKANLYANQNSDNPAGRTSEQSILKKIGFFSEYNADVLHFNFGIRQASSYQNISFNNLTTLKGYTNEHLQPPDLFI